MSDQGNAQSGSGDDILLNAAVDDHTKEFFDQFDKDIAKMRANIDNAATSSGGSMTKMGLIFGAAGAVASMAITAIVDKLMEYTAEISKFIEESIQLASKSDALAISLKLVGTNAGYSEDQLAEYEKGMIAIGMQTVEAREALTKMAQAQINLAESSKIAKVAQDAAAVGNISVADALERITYAIQSGYARSLKSMGLTVDFTAANAKYAASIGKLAKDLSETEKKQAAVNAVLEKGAMISGAYNATLGTASGIMREMPQIIEEVKTKLGGLFQPAHTVLLRTQMELWQGILDYINENDDVIKATGADLGELVSLALDGLGGIVKLLGDIVSIVPAALEGLYNIFGALAGNQDTTTPWFIQVMDTFIQAVILARGTLAMFGEIAKISFADMKNGAIAAFDAVAAAIYRTLAAYSRWIGKISDAEAYEASAAQLQTYADAARKAFEGAFTDTGKAERAQSVLDAYNKTIAEGKKQWDDHKKSADDAGKSINNFATITAQQLHDALTLMGADLAAIKKQLDYEIADRAVAAQRKVIEDAIQLAWQKEDIERNYAKQVEGITKASEDRKAEIVKQNADAGVKIEEDYRKRLEQIQKDFNDNAEEMARTRDAVGMLRLIRDNKRALEAAKKTRDDQHETLSKSYNEAVKTLGDNLKKQLEAANKSRTDDYDNLQRSLTRQATLQDLHDKWAAEDRAMKLARQLQDLIDHYAGMDSVTQAGLAQILVDWGSYYADLDKLIAEHYGVMVAGASVPGGSWEGTPAPKPSDPSGSGENVVITGAGGQVSELLARGNITPAMMGNMPRVPQVQAQSSRSVVDKRIHVTVDGTGLDPHIQRVVANTLYEIERNN